LEKGFVFSSNLQYVGSVVILYRLDFNPWWGLSDRTTVGGLRAVEGYLDKLATTVRYSVYCTWDLGNI
jgi:hypothetical protein